MSKNKKTMTVLLTVITVLLFVITMFPFFIVIINSAKASLEIIVDPIAMPNDWGQLLDNIKEIWSKPTVRYSSSVLTSVIITFCSLLTISVFSAMASWVLVRTKSKLSTIVFLVFLSGLIIPFQVVMFPLVSFFRVIKETTGIPMLRTYHGMIMAYIGFGAPLAVFMFHGFIKSIPKELEEAATIDGCTKPQIFFRIILPILKPIFVTVIILNAIWIWNDFLLPSLVLGVGQDIQTIPLAIRGFAGSFVKKWDLIMTAVLMAAAPVVIGFLFAQKHIIKGMVSGSIK
ncbi:MULTISPECIES: carbohydrate ABC transporter permease [unclassified Fusibacter]|uniref:carbohydrate ABC transporter permease n=1 Tax=unclassified Fusibacter TaxID=2624464 RepID=UPI0010121B2C|nr:MULTISPECIES: carbohydrate ABC transporter permease [unclassified Fusibacter]MCK8060454.1 carbohydrate ABC transporter permease [Fusibacter sp. A2]NPE20257.1 carbohydrate ABC transporter permease [Fusibacter sp. A1]RXV63464.1 carbohydrate ABC transporter permease [Fusibacter sp. A1]